MPLTPAIVPFLESLPDHVQGAWAIAFLKAQARSPDIPVEEAVEEANVALTLALHGFELDKDKAKAIDTEQWVQACVGRVWDVYLGQVAESWPQDRVPSRHLDLTDIRSGIIRQSLAKWRQSKARAGRTPEECLKDQVRGIFFVARQRQTEGGKVPRLDPEGVLALTKTTRAAALAWWAHLAFEEGR